MSLRRRSNRKITVNIQLSKQDLQEYLDDGYTAADIAKDFNVSPAIITEKIRKFGVRKTKQTKVVRKRERPILPKIQKPRERPPRRQSPPRKGKTYIKEQDTPSKNDSDSVITQVIQDNPEKSLDHIHSLLKSMGFDFEKFLVEDHLKKLKAYPASPRKKEKKSAKEDDVSSESNESSEGLGTLEKKDNEDDTSKATVTEVEGVTATQQTEDGLLKKMTERINGKELEKSDGSDDKEEASSSQKDKGTSEVREDDATDGRTSEDETPKPEPVKKQKRGRPRKVHLKEDEVSSEGKEGDATDGCIDENEPLKPDPVRKRRRGRPRKVHVKDEDTSTDASNDENDKDENGLDKEWSQDSETRKQCKRRCRKRKAEISEREQARSKRGRPCLDLSQENLKHCIESGLDREKIAEVFGTCRRSISRYLQIHRMRKKDRFSNLSDDEIDKVVSEMCSEHPDWGQIQIQEELAKKGLYFRRAQIRNSVRRVDPIGIELRKLNNLKLRWNRGSLKKLDKILPVDGINMTSTESFISQPPRTGLNSLNQEDSVRLLKSIFTTNKMTYVEHVPHKMDEQSLSSQGQDLPLVKEEPSVKEEKPVLKDDSSNEQEKESVEELVEAFQEIENTNDTMGEVSKETSDQENIGPEIHQQHDLKIESPQSSSLEGEKDLIWKERLYKMVMSNKRAGRVAAAQKRGPAVHIAKKELEECVNLGFSSARIAEKFGTSKRNVRRYLNLYKLGKARRFEKISDEKLDEIVMDVIQEFAIRKGSEVYHYVKRKGYQIRKGDVHKSLSRLFPKGLHRNTSSIVKQSWDASSEPHPSDISYIVTQEHRHETDADVSESVVMLNSEELAQLINGEGSIVLVDQQGSLSTRGDGELVVVSEGQGSHISTSIADTLVATGTTPVNLREDQISAIIVEIDFPENQTSGGSSQVADHMDGQGSNQMTQSSTTQQLSQEVVVGDESQTREHIKDVVVIETLPNSSDNDTGSDGPQLVIDHSEVANPQEQNSSTEQEVSLTSLNTVQPSELDAQMLLELDRIAQNYQATNEDHSLLVSKQTNNGKE